MEVFAPSTVSLWKRETALGLLPALGAEAEAGVGACLHLSSRGRSAGCGAPGILTRILPVTYVVISSRKVAVVDFPPILWPPHSPPQLFPTR